MTRSDTRRVCQTCRDQNKLIRIEWRRDPDLTGDKKETMWGCVHSVNCKSCGKWVDNKNDLSCIEDKSNPFHNVTWVQYHWYCQDCYPEAKSEQETQKKEEALRQERLRREARAREETARWEKLANQDKVKTTTTFSENSFAPEAIVLTIIILLFAGCCYGIFSLRGSKSPQRRRWSSTTTQVKQANTSPRYVTRPPSTRTHCGHPSYRPSHIRSRAWSDHLCLPREAASYRWKSCLRRKQYTPIAGKGCPGKERCCPQ